MNLTTKGDIVRAALRKLGVASDATLTDVEPQSMQDGVEDLEMMLAEWGEGGKGIVTTYLFSDPDSPPSDGDLHGLPVSAVSAVVHNLAVRIAPDYAMEASTKVVTTARYGKEHLYRASALSRAKRAPYPSRMPTGSGNRGVTLNEIHYYPGERPDADSAIASDEGGS